MIRNLVVTYGSQLYMAGVGIIMLPFYVAALGIEAYGIIALFIALQSWVALLDLGLSQTLGREMARFRSGAATSDELRALAKFVLIIFAAMAVLIWLVVHLAAMPIAQHWLHNEALPDDETAWALRLIGAVLALRFLCIPIRSLLAGAEDLQWLGAFNAITTSVRSILVLPVLFAVGPSLHVFFVWQLLTGALELVFLVSRAWGWIPKSAGRSVPIDALRSHWRFSLAMAAALSMWVAVIQMDKVILSGLLPLQDFSMFSVATIAAGGVLLLVGPFPIAIGPRLTRLHAEQRPKDLVRLYNQATQLSAVTAFPAAITLAIFPGQTLWGWTGNAQISDAAATVLTFYAAGNGLLAVSGLPVQLQIAAGRMKLHVAGTAMFAFLFLPLLWWATMRFGMAGAGASWLAVNLVFFACWVPFVHRHFLPEPHFAWLSRELLVVVSPTLAAGMLLKFLLPWPSDRWLVIAQLFAVGALLLLVASVSARTMREKCWIAIRRLVGPAAS